MKEYKIIKQAFSWTNAQQKFEDELNKHAKQGWQVVGVYHDTVSTSAILEKDKNR